MPLSRLSRLACLALALIFGAVTVNLTDPGVLVRTVAEPAPDADEDRDTELAAPTTSTQQAPRADRPATRSAYPSRRLDATGLMPPRVGRGTGTASADPLGSRLRC